MLNQFVKSDCTRPAHWRLVVGVILFFSLLNLVIVLPPLPYLPDIEVADEVVHRLQLAYLPLSFFVIGGCIYYLWPGQLLLSLLSMSPGVALAPMWLLLYLWLIPDPDRRPDTDHASEATHGEYADCDLTSKTYYNRFGPIGTSILLKKRVGAKVFLTFTLETFSADYDVFIKGVDAKDRLAISVNSDVRGMETRSLGNGRFHLTGRRIYGKSVEQLIDLKPYRLFLCQPVPQLIGHSIKSR